MGRYYYWLSSHILTYFILLNIIEDAIFDCYEAKCAAEWDAVVLTQHTGKSYVYNHIMKVRLKKGVDGTPLFKASKALQLVAKNDQSVCLMCKDVQGKDLLNSLLKMPENKSTNGNTHLKTVHKETLKKIEKEKEDAEKLKTKSKSKKEQPKRKTEQSKLPFPASTKKRKVGHNCKDTQDQVHKLIAKFANNKGLPDTIAANKDLRELIQFCIDNGYKLQDYIHLGVRKLVTIQCNNFEEFISKVSRLVEESRAWWVEETGTQQKFISVAHDVWDGIRSQINGVTIFFVHPETHTLYRIPIGMMPPGGKTGEALRDSCMEALQRVGITERDLFRSINDNCSTAKKTGRLYVLYVYDMTRFITL